jgi:hypothetical protein
MAHKIGSVPLPILAAHPCAAGNAEYFSVSLAVAWQAVEKTFAKAREGKPWMACTQIRQLKCSICRARHGRAPRRGELKKGSNALFQHPVRPDRRWRCLRVVPGLNDPAGPF